MNKEFIDLLTTYLGDAVKIKDNQIIITLEDSKLKDKINQLSDDTFTAVCESLGSDKVKELSDNEDYAKFIDEAKQWIDNKIDELQEELEMLSSED